MSRRKSGIANVRTFSFNVELETTGRRFRNYCYKNNLIMGAVLDKLMMGYLVEVEDVSSEEALRVEEDMLR